MSEETEYEIAYSLRRRKPGDDDYAEIGFGSSGGWNSLNACAYAVESDIQNYCWETERGMPDPDETRADISKALAAEIARGRL